MSREVRRVPLDWEHPVKYNEHWQFQASTPFSQSKPASQLHGPKERFAGLMGDYADSLARWQEELADLKEHRGHSWKFGVEYHLTGYKGMGDSKPIVHPFYTFSDDGMTEISVVVRDEDHLHELTVEQKLTEEPVPADYMPPFDVPADELGWCLYETVSEGTPVTPVFATADELVDHLAAVGQDYDQIPLRRAAAESIVRQGGTFGSMVVIGGQILDSTMDADKIEGTA